MWSRLACVAVAFASGVLPAAQQRESAATGHTLQDLPQSLFFELPAAKPAKKSAKVGGGLVVVLPGGDGSRDFLPWVENSLLAQRPDDCVGVLVTAVKWRDDQQIVWPTERNRVPGMQYTTGEYVRAVVKDVEQRHRVDPARRVVVAWSSSGPAVYPLLCDEDGPFARAYVAMSIWPRGLADLAGAKGRRFFLDQSPDDQVTAFRFVREAYDALDGAGAVVRLSVYQGGHGWHDEPLPRIREGLRWLLSNEPAPAPQWPAATPTQGKPGDNLLANGGFESGLDGWQVLHTDAQTVAEVVKRPRKSGKQALHVQRQGGLAVPVVQQTVELAGARFTVRAALRTKAAKGAPVLAWVKAFVFDAAGKQLHEDVDLVAVDGNQDWRVHERTWPTAGGVRAVVQVVLGSDGELWVDDVSLVFAE